MRIPNIYKTPKYKYYILISIAFGILALMVLPGLKYGIDLHGGTQLIATVDHPVDEGALASHLEQYELDDLSVRFTENPLTGRRGVVIEFTGTPALLEAESLLDSDPEASIALSRQFVAGELAEGMTAREALELAKADFAKNLHTGISSFLEIPETDISSVEIGAALGREFWRTSRNALILAFFLIAAIVFILFRELVPSVAVLQAAFYDVLIALAGMSIFGIPLSLATIAGLLMIIGHSVDTDILSTDMIMNRREGTTAERAHEAMLTGLTITGTLLVVLAVVVVFSYLNQMGTMFQIAAVLMFGMLGDLPSTYCTSTVMIKWWADRKQQ